MPAGIKRNFQSGYSDRSGSDLFLKYVSGFATRPVTTNVNPNSIGVKYSLIVLGGGG